MAEHVVAILGTRYRDFAIEEQVLGPLGVSLVSGDGGTADSIVEQAAGATVILAGSRPRFDADVLERLSCRGIVRYGVGTDSIDLDAARASGIAVARVSDYGTAAVAFHAVSMALAQLRRLLEADRAIRAGAWGFAELRPMHEPSRLTAGVVGYGRIGRQVATHLNCLGMQILAYDPYVEIADSEGVRPVDLVELLRGSDVVLLHAPGNPDGGPLLDSKTLAHMRSGSILVNTARGSLVDLPALLAGLRQGRPGRAALDVYPDEPVEVAMFGDLAERILFTPHMAWYTEESETDLRRKAAAEAARMLRGEPLVDAVGE
ncbi:MAG TPA: C-terminal binding protein [Jiangellales bacterium]|nr:C-terminal binding protein [Jiangellales bacterium]